MNKQALDGILDDPTQWLLTWKADGKRTWMVLSGTDTCGVTLFERSNPAKTRPHSHIKVAGPEFEAMFPFHRPPHVTILDGEMLFTDTLFVAFDILMLNDNQVTSWDCRSRVRLLTDSTRSCWPVLSPIVRSTSVPSSSIQVALKPVTVFAETTSSEWFHGQPGHGQGGGGKTQLKPLFFHDRRVPCDGLILMHARRAYWGGRGEIGAPPMLKWKMTPTIDLAVHVRGRISDFVVSEPVGFCQGYHCRWFDCGRIEMSDVIKQELRVKNPGETVAGVKIEIVECEWAAPRRWRALKWRADKSMPNHEKVVNDTIAVLREQITAEVMIAALDTRAAETAGNAVVHPLIRPHDELVPAGKRLSIGATPVRERVDVGAAAETKLPSPAPTALARALRD